MPKEKPSRTFLEQAARVGAYPALGLAMLLGASKINKANAAPTKAGPVPAAVGGPMRNLESAHQKQPFKTHPDGVKVLWEFTSAQKAAVAKEQLEAFNKLRAVWPGILILHTPKKNCSVGFTKSPSAYDSISQETTYRNDLDVTHGGTPQFWGYQDVGIEEFSNGRDYAVVYSHFGPAFLDIKWAADCGALTMLRYKDVPEKAVHYKGVPPLPINGDLREGSWLKWFDDMSVKSLPDSKNKLHDVEISHTLPHP